MKVSMFDLLVILGIAQGLYTGTLLLTIREKRQPNVLLAFVLFSFILLSCKILLHSLQLWNTHGFRYFPLAVDLLLQPLIYLYVRGVSAPQVKLQRRDWIHFFPVVIFLLHAIVVYVKVQTVSDPLEKDLIAEALFYNDVKNFEDILSIISAVVYGIFSYSMLQAYRRWLHDNISDIHYPTYNWLRNILMMFGVLVIILTVNIIVDRSRLVFFEFYHWQAFYLCIAAIIYYMGFRGYYFQAATQPVRQTVPDYPPIAYSKEVVDDAVQKITTALQVHKVYRDPELSLAKLAEITQVPSALLSHAVNNAMKVNFRSLVNHYRVEEMRQKLFDPNLKHLSIFGLALECGFNSEASFYRIFKNVTGMTPKEYIMNSK